MRLTFLFLFVCASTIFAQAFPEGWTGKYAGIMEIINGMNKQEVAVEFELLELKKDSLWTYKMIYKTPNQAPLIKDYLLQRSGAAWTFVIDEQDGIQIDVRLMGNVFYDFYEANGMFFASRLSKEKKGLFFELMGGMKSDFRKTTSGISELTEVYSYPPAFVQRVQLKKIN
jgi:hypothetical protein